MRKSPFSTPRGGGRNSGRDSFGSSPGRKPMMSFNTLSPNSSDSGDFLSLNSFTPPPKNNGRSSGGGSGWSSPNIGSGEFKSPAPYVSPRPMGHFSHSPGLFQSPRSTRQQQRGSPQFQSPQHGRGARQWQSPGGQWQSPGGQWQSPGGQWQERGGHSGPTRNAWRGRQHGKSNFSVVQYPKDDTFLFKITMKDYATTYMTEKNRQRVANEKAIVDNLRLQSVLQDPWAKLMSKLGKSTNNDNSKNESLLNFSANESSINDSKDESSICMDSTVDFETLDSETDDLGIGMNHS